MRLGVEEYKQKLATELETVSRQLASERKKQQALEVYRDKVPSPPRPIARSCSSKHTALPLKAGIDLLRLAKIRWLATLDSLSRPRAQADCFHVPERARAERAVVAGVGGAGSWSTRWTRTRRTARRSRRALRSSSSRSASSPRISRSVTPPPPPTAADVPRGKAPWRALRPREPV